MRSQVLLISRLDISAVFSRKRWGLHFWNIRMNTDFLFSTKIWSIRKTLCMWFWNAMDSTIISCFDGCSRSTSGAHLRRCGRICGNNSTFSYTIQSSHCMADFPTILVPRLYRAFHSRLPLSLRVPTVLSYCSTGISTCCPSATALALTLGPDSPRADQLYPGNLGYSA